MAQLNIEDSLVLIIDIQDRLLNAVFNKELVQKKSAIIARAAGILNIPVIVTEQYPKGLGNTVETLRSSLDKETLYFEKTAFSALVDLQILDAIKKNNCKQIVIFGIETHICVNQTAEALIRAGFEVNVISDACGSRAESEYQAGLNRMKDNGAHVLTTEIALFEWLKEIQALIK